MPPRFQSPPPLADVAQPLHSQAPHWWRSPSRPLWHDAGLGGNAWSPAVAADAERVHSLIAASAMAGMVLHAPFFQADSTILQRVFATALLALAGSTLWSMPRAFAHFRSTRPGVVFWFLLTITGAGMDASRLASLGDVLWWVLPGMLSVATLGFFLRWREQALWTLGLAAICTPMVVQHDGGARLLWAVTAAILSTLSFGAHLYRRSVRTAQENEQLHKERLRNLARVLPAPMLDALSSEDELRQLMAPSLRQVLVVSVDVRGSTKLLRRMGARAYLDTVQPLVTQLYSYARRLEAFAKFEGDGLLVVFGAFHEGVSDNLIEHAVGFLELCAAAVEEVNRLHGDRLPQRLSIGVGVATGEAVAGSVSNPDHELMFDVVGECLAHACRLESFSKQLPEVQARHRNVAIATLAGAQLLASALPMRPLAATEFSVRDFEDHDQLFLLDLDRLQRDLQRGHRQHATSSIFAIPELEEPDLPPPPISLAEVRARQPSGVRQT